MKTFWRIWITLWVLVCAICFWLFWNIETAKADECHSLESFKSEVMPQIPGGTLTPLDKKKVSAFVRLFNTLPPVSSFEADEVFIVTIPGDRNKVAILFNGGCGTVFQRLSPATFMLLMGDDT